MNPNDFYAIIPESLAWRDLDDRNDEMVLSPGTGLIACCGVMGPNDYAGLQAKISKMADDPGISRILLSFHSPGGSVLGISPLIALIRGVKKEIIAIANHVCASAAYWIAAACDKIYLASQTAVVGSVGVIATHVDYSKMEEMWGAKVTEIVAGTQKNLASPYRKIDEAARQYYQNRVDEIYSIFVDDVALGRKIDAKQVIALEGTDLIGQSAINAGLADGFVNFLEYVSMAKISEKIVAKMAEDTEEKAEDTEKEEEKAEDTEDAEEEKAEDTEDAEEEKAEDTEEEAEEDMKNKAIIEQDRILAILDVAGVQLSADAIKAIKAGDSAEKFAFSAIKAMRGSGQAQLSALQASAPKAVATMQALNKDDENSLLALAAAGVNQQRR